MLLHDRDLRMQVTPYHAGQIGTLPELGEGKSGFEPPF